MSINPQQSAVTRLIEQARRHYDRAALRGLTRYCDLIVVPIYGADVAKRVYDSVLDTIAAETQLASEQATDAEIEQQLSGNSYGYPHPSDVY